MKNNKESRTANDKYNDAIKVLEDAREHSYVLLSMLHRDHKSLKKKIELATKTQNNLDDAIFWLTGNEFYRRDETK
jgi:hypothetical protein